MPAATEVETETPTEPRHIPPELVFYIVRELVALDGEAAHKLSQWDAHSGGSSRQPNSWLAVSNFSIEVLNELKRVCLVNRAFAAACLPYIFRSVFVDADATRFTPARSKMLQQIVERNSRSIVALDINYPQFSTRTNSTARINKDLRSVVSQLPNLMCMQVSGMRPTLSSLLQDQPDLASRITVLHLGDLGNPLSNRPSEPQLGFLEVLQQATQLKTLVVTAIDELSRPQDIEAWWSALLSPRAHPMTLGLTNPPPLPQDWVSRFEAASDSSAPRLQLRQLHLNYSRRDGSFDTVLSLRRLCSGFSTLRGLELSGIRDWAGEEALRQAPLPELQVLALDSMASLAAAHHHHDPERLSRLLQHWTPQQQLRLGRCEGLSLEHIRSALEAATTAASRVKEVYLSTACLSLFEDLASLLAFQEALRQPPTGVKVCFDPQLPRLLQAQTLLDNGDDEDDSGASSDTFEPGSPGFESE